MSKIGVVLVSHSEKIASGLKELVDEMNDGSVPVIAAGGADGGRIGTDASKIIGAIESLEDCDYILIYCDLGSSIMSTEAALDLVDEEVAEKCTIVDCPIVEGALAGVVMACGTGNLDEAIQASIDARLALKL